MRLSRRATSIGPGRDEFLYFPLQLFLVMSVYMAEFKLRYGDMKWYVRRVVEASSIEEARELARRYAEAMTRGEVLWELSYVIEADRPLMLGAEELKKLGI